MMKFSSPLNDLKIADPCTANWDEMVGNDRVRFCGECKLNVFNLSKMTQTEAENLIRNTQGRLCARFYRRADGSVLTENCPTGLRAARIRMAKIATAALSAILSFAAGLGLQSASTYRQQLNGIGIDRPVPTTGTVAMPTPPQPPLIQITPRDPGEVKMGKIAMPPKSGGVVMGEIAPTTKGGAACTLKNDNNDSSMPTMGRIAAPVKPEVKK